jgi:Acyl dehydratase
MLNANDVVTDDTLADNVATGIAGTVVPAPRVINGLDGLRDAAGTDLGASRWVTIDQDLVNSFARVTNDEQWIHVDPQKAKDGPFGGTVAHGFLTMSLATSLLWDVAVVSGVDVILNYGLNKVRFPAPVKVGSRLRMHVTLAEVNEIKGGVETIFHLVYETEEGPKPPCVADMVWRYYA